MQVDEEEDLGGVEKEREGSGLPFRCTATALSLTMNCCSSRLSASLSLEKSMGWSVVREREESIAGFPGSLRVCCSKD